MSSTKIKICGLTTIEDVNYINEAGVEYAGFVFYPPSKRNLTPEKARELMAAVNSGVKKVAVVVSPDSDMINMLEELPIDIIQIHKHLSPEIVSMINRPIWYAVNVTDSDEVANALDFVDSLPDEDGSKIKAIVVDAADFGSGKTFNWRKSRRMLKAGAQSPPEDMMFVLAGGLNVCNVAEGIEIFKPDVVDVSSGVEGDTHKDRDKIMEFVTAVRQADGNGE